MKLSEYIVELQKVLHENGDRDVYTYGPSDTDIGCDYHAPRIAIDKKDVYIE